MQKARVFFALSFGVALGAACGGSSSTPNDDAGSDGSSGSSSGGRSSSSSGASGGSSGSSSSSGGGARDGGDAAAPACMIGACTTGQVCCQMGCQPQVNCGTTGNRQLCTSNTDCTAAMYPRCQITGGAATGTCRMPTACTPMGCAANGQVCCMGTPVAACMGTCPAGTQLCAMKADCPTAQTCCMGMGAMATTTCNAGACPAGTNPTCATNADCATGTACCQGGCQAVTACGATGNRQVCATNADCTAAMYPRCQLGGGGATTGTCRMPMMEGGAPEGGPDTGLIDSAIPDTGTPDAPTGG